MAASSYITPFSVLIRDLGLTSTGGEVVNINREQLFDLIRQLLVCVHVDEAWYKASYPDVETAIRSGAFRNAKEHFVANGYFEGRLPAKINVDEGFYTKRYPDVAERIEDGEVASAQEHFEAHGFVEGRLPFEL